MLNILALVAFFYTEMPDSVSMSQRSQMVHVVEGQEYSMQCDIVNVAPASRLSVHWHKGNNILNTTSFIESSLSPVNKSSVMGLIAHRNDNGTQIWCEAELKFEPTGPNLPAIHSAPHEVIVLCKSFMPSSFNRHITVRLV